MKRKLLIFIIILGISTGIIMGSIAATLMHSYSLPQTATPPSPTPTPNPVSATFTINGQAWTDGTLIAWGQLQNGNNVLPITITNTGSVAISSVVLSSPTLPSGWTEVFTQTSVSGDTIFGTITLHADASVTTQQSWTTTITLNS
jgi:hypothetical protein